MKQCGALGRLDAGLRPRVLLRVGGGGDAHPLALAVRCAARGEPLTVARAVAAHHPPEFVPINRPDRPVLRLFIKRELRIWYDQIDRLRLRDSEIDKTLTQLVIAL